ncbi:hypothetical protein [Paraburkholderia tagetis]|uniref:Uncharacterized protein n=1 Tax=Paraburkholderia tagetis TaxID=2913261 RepID=A0A9X1ULR2_9BURK|nr:hypothetical protein [Paraburkholderia tagetis]MCG5077708.1 hypothetical protein [Paraburkholderia tagetis]
MRHYDQGDHARGQHQRCLGPQAKKAELIEKNQIKANKKMREIERPWRQERLHQQAQAHERQPGQQDPVCNLVAMKCEPEGQRDTDGRDKRTCATECEYLWKIRSEHRTGSRKTDFPIAETHPDQRSEHERRTAEVGETPAIVFREFLFDARILESGWPAKHVDQPRSNRARRGRAFKEFRFRRRLKPEYVHRHSPVFWSIQERVLNTFIPAQ